ncbi:uncharacterized protein [Primulina huaijiensis]|uniref:uncharacterized protein isoform X2 n=1 Tax=Primulina huaijiensis TaxID=1492673 RepID=UPI003CC70441
MFLTNYLLIQSLPAEFSHFSINVLLFSKAVDEPLKKSFQNIDHRHESETLVRFLKARDGNVLDAHQMKPIDTHMYTSIRESQLVGISGYSKEPSATKKYGRYISTGIKILDMTGLKLSALSQIKLYNNIKEQSAQVTLPVPIKQGSFHVDFPEPDPEDVKIAQTKKMSFKESVTKTGFPTHYISLT